MAHRKAGKRIIVFLQGTAPASFRCSEKQVFDRILSRKCAKRMRSGFFAAETKNHRISDAVAFLELLSRFELETSSLPIMRLTIYIVKNINFITN